MTILIAIYVVGALAACVLLGFMGEDFSELGFIAMLWPVALIVLCLAIPTMAAAGLGRYLRSKLL